MGSLKVSADPTCLPISLKKVNEDGSTNDDGLKLGLRNTEILIFWEPNPEYNCTSNLSNSNNIGSDTNLACGRLTPPKIALYTIFEKYLNTELASLYTDEDSPSTPISAESVNTLGGAESSIKYGTLTACVNLPGTSVFSWGGAFTKGVKMRAPGIKDNNPCLQSDIPIPPPCPETDIGFNVGSFVSRIVTIRDSIAAIAAVKDNLMTILLRSNLYDTFIDSKIYTGIEDTTLEDTQLSVNYLFVGGFSRFKNVNIDAKAHVLIKDLQPFTSCVTSTENASDPQYELSRIVCNSNTSTDGAQSLPGYGYEGGQIDTVGGGSLQIENSSLKDVTINSSCFSASAITCDNCTISLGNSSKVSSLKERLDSIKDGGITADPIIQRRRDAYNKFLALHNYVGAVGYSIQKPYQLDSDPNALGMRYFCNNYKCPERYIEDELLYDDSICTEQSRSGCLEYLKDFTTNLQLPLTLSYNERHFRQSMLNMVNSYDVYRPDELNIRTIQQGDSVLRAEGLEYRDYEGLSYANMQFNQPFRFNGVFKDSVLNVDGDMISRGISLRGASLFNNSQSLTLAGDGSSNENTNFYLTIPSPSRAEVNHIYGGIIFLDTTFNTDDPIPSPRAELIVNGFMGSFLDNMRAGEAKLHRTYAFGGLYSYNDDNILNGPRAIIRFYQPNIILNHKDTQQGSIFFNNAFVGPVNYTNAFLKGTKLTSTEEDTINLGGIDNIVVDNPRPDRNSYSFSATNSTIDIGNIIVNFINPKVEQLYSEYYGVTEKNYTDLGLGQCIEFYDNNAGFGQFFRSQHRVGFSFSSCGLTIGSVNLRSGSSLVLNNCNGTINSITGTEKMYVMRPIMGDTFISVPWRDSDGYIIPGMFRRLRRRTAVDFELKRNSVTTLIVRGNSNLNIPALTITEFNIEEGATLTGSNFTSAWDGVERYSQLGGRNDVAKPPERISRGTLSFNTIEMGGEPFRASDDPDQPDPIQRLEGSVFCGSLILKNFTLSADVLSAGSIDMTQSRLQSDDIVNNVTMRYFSMNAGNITNSVLSNSATIGGVSNSTLNYCEVAGSLGGKIEMKGCSAYYGGGLYHNTIRSNGPGEQEGRSLGLSTSAVVNMKGCYFSVNTLNVGIPNDENFNGPYGTITLENSWISYLDGFAVGEIKVGAKSFVKGSNLSKYPLPTSTNAFSAYYEIEAFLAGGSVLFGMHTSTFTPRIEVTGPLSTLQEVHGRVPINVSANNRITNSYFNKKITLTSSETRYCVIKEGEWKGGTGKSAFEWLAPQEENENQSDIVSLTFSNLSSNIIGPDGEKVSNEQPQSYDYKSYGSPVAQGSGPSFFLGSPVEDNLALLRRSADNAEPLPKVSLEYTRIENSTPGTQSSSDISSPITSVSDEAGGGGVTAGGGGGNEGGTGSTTSPSDTSPSIYSAEPMQEFLPPADNRTVDWESTNDIVSVNIASISARSGDPLPPSGTSRYGGFSSIPSGNVRLRPSVTLPANSGAVRVSGDSSGSEISGIGGGGSGGYAIDLRGAVSGTQRYTPPSQPIMVSGSISGNPVAVPVAASGGPVEYTDSSFTGVVVPSSDTSSQMFTIGNSFSGVLNNASSGVFEGGASISSGVPSLTTIKIFMDTSFVDLRNSWQKKIHWGDKIYANGTLVGPIIAYDPYENFVKVNVVQENIATQIRELGANAKPLAGASLELEGSYGGGPIRPLINDPGIEKIKVATPTVSREPTSFNTKNKQRKVVPASFEEAKMAGIAKSASSASSNHTDVELRYSDVGSYIGIGSFENVNVSPALVAGKYDTVTTFKNSTMRGKLGAGKFLFDNSIFWQGEINPSARIEFKQSITSKNFSMTVGSAGSLILNNAKSFGTIIVNTISSDNVTVRADGGSENYGTIEGGGSVQFRGSDNIGTIQNLNDLDFTSSSNQGLIKDIEYLTFNNANNLSTIDNRKAFNFTNSFNGGSVTIHEGLCHFLSSTNGGAFTSELIYLEAINPLIPATANYAGDFVANGAYRAPPVLHLAPQNFDQGASDPFSDCREALGEAEAAGFISDGGGTPSDIRNVLDGVTETLGYYITLGSPDPGQVRLTPSMNDLGICEELLASPYAPTYDIGDYANSSFPDAVMAEGLWYDTENFRLSHVSFVVGEENRVSNGLYASGINPLDVFPRGSVIAEQVIMPFSGLAPNETPTDPVYLKAEKYIFNLNYENDRPFGY